MPFPELTTPYKSVGSAQVIVAVPRETAVTLNPTTAPVTAYDVAVTVLLTPIPASVVPGVTGSEVIGETV